MSENFLDHDQIESTEVELGRAEGPRDVRRELVAPARRVCRAALRLLRKASSPTRLEEPLEHLHASLTSSPTWNQGMWDTGPAAGMNR
ncbi:hypothetical protein [Streptomyces sp. NPDC003393]